MDSLGFYVPAAVAGAAFVFKLPALVRSRQDPLMRSVGGLLLIASGVFFFAAPPTISTVNALTGVPNFSAPLVYGVLTAFCASCLVLIINWRGGDGETVRRATRWCVGVYSGVIVALVVLFVLADAPVERLRDLDTYYADTPFMREMIVLYLTAHTVAVVTTTVLCWRWSRQIHGWLRAGVSLIVFGYLLNIVYDSVKFAAVFARWSGRNWDWLSTDVAPPVASLSGVLIGIGFVLPMAGQRASKRWHAHRAYRRLEPLWRELRQVAPGTGSVRMPRWSAPELLLTQRRADIHDGLLLLTPYFDAALREAARTAALERGATAKDAVAISDAAMTVAAALAKTAAQATAAAPAGQAEPAGTAERTRGAGGVRGGPRTFVRESSFDLLQVSGALRHPVVADLRRRADRSESVSAP